ncbi:MAG: acylase [Woeseia sp.]
MKTTTARNAIAVILISAIAAIIAGCATTAEPGKEVRIQRTAHGVAHIEAPDYESLAYGVAYAHAEDNVCQTANHLVTIRGERSRFFGAERQALLGLRVLPNQQIDIFVRAHMDDAALAEAQNTVSREARALARGYVDGYNRYLREHMNDGSSGLPAACAGKPWVRPMTAADYLRLQELTMVQLGVALMADAVVTASPPVAGESAGEPPALPDAAAALERFQFDRPAFGSNGWAFGSEVTANGRGVLLGNPHFPWAGVNRFWQMHLTIPGRLDVMGGAIGHSAVVQIGFNKDVAWTHTVSTGQRFTLHELQLVEGDPTRYVLDGESVPMSARNVSYEVRNDESEVVRKDHTIWMTQFGPVIEVPRAGLSWDGTHAYALKDANTLNLRAMEIWLGFNRAESVEDMHATLGELGVPWVNTMAADRNGEVLYADVSVVPDIDAEHLRRCAPSGHAAGLFKAAGLVVLDGSRSECDWGRDEDSPVPGLLPIERMPVAVRRDWVQNSNDSFWLSNPDIAWPEFSPMIGAVDEEQSLRTRAGLYEIGQRLSASDRLAEHRKVDLAELQAMLFRNRNHAAYLVLDDFLPVCERAPTEDSRDGCAALAAWDRRNNLGSRGAHLFREWWRAAEVIEGLWREPFDPADPANTPAGLNTEDAIVRSELLSALESAVATVRAAGFALDAPLGEVQIKKTRNGDVGLHGGTEMEGVLNKVETIGTDTLEPGGYEINFGSSYIQTVTFDERGPVAQAIMTYGQSSQADSPFAFDQLPLYTDKKWPVLPFHADDVTRERVGDVLHLTTN